MGDAESSIENAMMRIFKSGLQSSILKVAHHGSRYSSTDQFLARVQPKYAFISVGLDNVYGHPHKEALDRLKAAGAKIFMTTHGGTQSVTIPAPGKGVSFPAEPIINEQALTAEQKVEQKVEEMPLTWTAPDQMEMNSESLSQLQSQLAAN